MVNKEIAEIFYEIANFLEMDEVPFKPVAYKRVAIALENLEEDVRDVYLKGGREALEDLPGVGKSIAEKIEEYLQTGKIKYHGKLKKKKPMDVEGLIAIEGLGPKRVKTLYQKLGIKNIKELEKAAKTGKIAPLFGFGEKTEKNILEGIEFLKRSKGRFLLGFILPKAREFKDELQNLKEVERVEIAGSLRRRKETIGDLDILVITKKPKKVMNYIVSIPEVVKVWGKGPTKTSVRMKDGFDIDIRAVAKKSYGSALQYFTGSKEHNVETRKIAISKGLKLNEYGVFRKKKMIAGWSESGIYRVLGLAYPAPELRENQGEVGAALKGRLPRIIGYNDLKGDLHCHTDWDGGENSILEMAEKAQSLDYEYLGISDHTKFLRIERGLDEKRLGERNKEIDKLNKKFESEGIDLRLLKGAEANILKDGSLDIKDEALAKLDYAIAGIHSNFKMKKSEMTKRIIRAIKNPRITILSHPTGRILQRRDEYQIDFDKILKVAKEFRVVLEINSYPKRLDLNDINIRRAKESGVKMVINSDAHHKNQLSFVEFGISQACRGWAEKEDIINTKSLKELLEFFSLNKGRSK
jgi:DNA polymerase (family 10)